VVQQESIETDYLHFTRLRKTLAGFWTMRLTLSTLADAVPPESLDEHRETIDEIRAQSAWSILVPVGDPRPRERGDFAELPRSWDPNFSMPSPSEPHAPLSGGTGPAAATAQLANGGASPPTPAQSTLSKKSKRRKRKHDSKSGRKRRIVGICALAVILLLVVYFAAKYADRWHVFKYRPKPPEPALNNGLVQ
jgi:hypothetical protein